MNKNKNFIILYFILFTVIAIIGIQVYWNIKNFANTKTKISENIQVTLDNTIDEFYIDRSKKIINIFLKDSSFAAFSNQSGIKLDKIVINTDEKNQSNNQSLKPLITKKSVYFDTIEISNSYDSSNKKNPKLVLLEKFKIETNTTAIRKQLAKKIDTKIFKKFLTNSGNVLFFENNKQVLNYNLEKDTFENTISKIVTLKIEAKSKEILKKERIVLQNINIDNLALKESWISIILSFLLSVSIIFCLFYLLKIINKQKQIDEIKNDFISNITHELKTPIAVVTSAVEGIQNFNAENDSEKTKKYLKISEIQLQKLNNLVEKILETATLDSQKIKLAKEVVFISDFVEKCIFKEKISTNKTIQFHTENASLKLFLDVFHFENIINNLLQNAIKYGGDTINVSIKLVHNNIEIYVSDNGKAIEKQYHKKVFDKFYRIPTQNIHNVKGFGIGLYYISKMLFAHNGSIEILPIKTTSFKITLPYEN